MHNSLVFYDCRTHKCILDQCKGGTKVKRQKKESCRGMLSSHTKSWEQHAATWFPCAVAWRPLTKPTFLTHAATCQITPWREFKNLKIKKPMNLLSFLHFSNLFSQIENLHFPQSSILSTLTNFASKPIKIPSNLISKTPISQYNS